MADRRGAGKATTDRREKEWRLESLRAEKRSKQQLTREEWSEEPQTGEEWGGGRNH